MPARPRPSRVSDRPPHLWFRLRRNPTTRFANRQASRVSRLRVLWESLAPLLHRLWQLQPPELLQTTMTQLALYSSAQGWNCQMCHCRTPTPMPNPRLAQSLWITRQAAASRHTWGPTSRCRRRTVTTHQRRDTPRAPRSCSLAPRIHPCGP